MTMTTMFSGDVLCVMSQFGEIEDINLARDEDTGKSRGFAFVKYEDARSCILAVDNLVGIKVRACIPLCVFVYAYLGGRELDQESMHSFVSFRCTGVSKNLVLFFLSHTLLY